MKSILQSVRECYITHDIRDLDKHHIMNGSFRGKSERFGLWVWLRHDQHMNLHHTPEGQIKARELKQQAQAAFEEIYGHDRWMAEFHKNYL